jgi:hypothetical protein
VTRSLITAALRRRRLARRYLFPIVVLVSTFTVLALGLDGRVVGSCNLCRGRGNGRSSNRGRWWGYE